MAKAQHNLTDTKIAEGLYKNISLLIEQSRKQVALVVNQEMTLLYWHIGKTITTTLLKNKRADYGEAIVATLSQQLFMAHCKGLYISSINRMINFYKTFDDKIQNNRRNSRFLKSAIG